MKEWGRTVLLLPTIFFKCSNSIERHGDIVEIPKSARTIKAEDEGVVMAKMQNNVSKKVE